MRTSRKRCASSNWVRTFGRAAALHPVPLTYEREYRPASASMVWFRNEDMLEVIIDRGERNGSLCRRRWATEPFRPHAGRARNKKSRAWMARLRVGEIYSLWLYRIAF